MATRRKPRSYADFNRDGYRCTMPGCTGRAMLERHHVRFKSNGGPDIPDNRGTLCAFHHHADVHQQLARITGRAPDRLLYELGIRADGPPLARYGSGDWRCRKCVAAKRAAPRCSLRSTSWVASRLSARESDESDPVVREYADEELVLGRLLREKAERNRSRTFLRFRDGDLSYADANELSSRAAAGFAAAGIGRGDHVGLMLSNGPELLWAIFALAKLGAVAVPINTAYKGEMLDHVLGSSDACALVVDAAWLPRLEALSAGRPALRRLFVRGSDSEARAAPAEDARPLRRLLDTPSAPPDTRVHHGDLQAIMFTAGTTGPSKGVMVPHAHALLCARDWLRFLDYRPEERIYCPLPLFHGGALWDGVFAALLADSEIAIVERFSASRFWDDVRRFGSNVALGIFAMLPILLSRPARDDDRDHPLRAFYLGQSAVDDPMRERFGVRSVETYASTEAGIVTGSPCGRGRPGSCGRVNGDTYEAKLVDRWDREVPPGEPGELVVRPVRPFAMTTGYYNFWRTSVDCFRNLWFHTGDRLRRDRDGWFFFVDRLSDTIRRRGENISSFEVERAVNTHPAVLESAAVAVPSELAEDEVKVCIVPRDRAHADPEEIIAHCEERLPSFMVPRYVEVLDFLPKSAIGKIQKSRLREGGVTPATYDRTKRG